MAYDLTFSLLDLFGDGDQQETAEAIGDMVNALALIDARWLRARPAAPLLYQAGLRYQPEPPGQERWQNVAAVLARRTFFDCEDICAWRLAELRIRGIDVRPYVTWSRLPNGEDLYHVRVLWPDGRIEDPSRVLGMP